MSTINTFRNTTSASRTTQQLADDNSGTGSLAPADAAAAVRGANLDYSTQKTHLRAQVATIIETLWDIGENHENLLAAFHVSTNALVAKDFTQALEAFAVPNYHALAAHEHVQERIDFSSDCVECGKSQALLLQRYLRWEYQPYVYSLYGTTKQKFAELRAQAYAKEFNKQAASTSVARSIKGNNYPNRSTDSRTSKQCLCLRLSDGRTRNRRSSFGLPRSNVRTLSLVPSRLACTRDSLSLTPQ